MVRAHETGFCISCRFCCWLLISEGSLEHHTELCKQARKQARRSSDSGSRFGDLMEAAISFNCSGASAAEVVRRFGGKNQTRKNSSSTRVFIQVVRPSATLRIEGRKQGGVVGGRDERAPRRRETKLWYSSRPNSVAEAQNRFESSNSNSSSVLNREEDDAAKVESRGDNEGAGGEDSLEKSYKMARVCDRLIEVFMIEKTTPTEWRKLLAFSGEWSNIRPHFFTRCSTNAKAEEDPKRRGDLLKLGRQLKEVDEDMMRHDELLGEIEKNELALDAIVAKRRKDFTGDFFDHLHTLCDANYKNLDRRDEIATLAKKCLSAIEAHDGALEDSESLGEAQLKFDDILNSPSLEAAVNKIDKLAQRQELDSTLMLLITKAWAAAKESTMMKEEVKDILFHLYNVARGNMQRLLSKEVRILRYLLSIRDPREQRAALMDAFSPGNELEGQNEDLLYTTPTKLHQWIKVVLDAYRTERQSTLVKEAQKLMNPEVISRVEMLKKVVEDDFM